MSTELPRMGKSVDRVIALESDPAGGYRAITIYDKGRKRKKKQSAGVKQLGKAVRRFHDAQLRYDQSYLGRHDNSNTKRRDGWMRDLPVNVIKAGNKGRRRIKIF